MGLSIEFGERMNCKIGNTKPKTLAQLIYQKTGQRLPAFAEFNKFNLYNLIGWSLITSESKSITKSRQPNKANRERLAKILKVKVEQIDRLTRRKK